MKIHVLQANEKADSKIVPSWDSIVKNKISSILMCPCPFMWDQQKVIVTSRGASDLPHRTIVEQEQDPPLSLIKLNSVAEKEEGWLQVGPSYLYTVGVVGNKVQSGQQPDWH